MRNKFHLVSVYSPDYKHSDFVWHSQVIPVAAVLVAILINFDFFKIISLCQ